MPFTYAENGGVVGFAGRRSEDESKLCKEKGLGVRESPSGKGKSREDGKKERDIERTRAREKRSLSARSSEKASVQRQGANEIVGYVLSTPA